jgi:Protein of unknown function (DUF3592)
MAELTDSRPRNVALTAGGRALVVLAFVLFAGAIAAGIGMYGEARRQAADRRAIVQDGVMTTGVVTRLWRDGDNRRRVRYEFAVNGRVVGGDRRVSAERREGLTMGSPIDVRYLPARPTVNDLGDPPRSGLPMALPFVVAPLIAALGALCFFLVHRQRRLLSEGFVASAIVTGHAKHSSSDGGTYRSILYTFPLLSGAMASGKSSASRKPPAVGSVITVVYDPDRPGKNGVYPFSLVKPWR